MALVHLNFESEYIGSNTDVNIILPDRPREVSAQNFYGNGKKYRVLWLLHGTFGDYTDWLRKSNIELYACENDLIVVMPAVGNSDYSAWNNFTLGYDSEKYIIEELMPLVYNWLPASKAREDNFIAGLSMGGQGTLKFALKYPAKFAGAAVLGYAPSDLEKNRDALEKLFDQRLSDVMDDTDIMHIRQRQYNVMHRYETLDDYLNSDDNLWKLVEKVNPDDLPQLFFACGTEDPLMGPQFPLFRKHLEELGIQAQYSQGPGSHEWRVWERDIQKALAFFGITDQKKGNAF